MQSVTSAPTTQYNIKAKTKAPDNAIKVSSPTMALTSIQSHVADENKQEGLATEELLFS
jgi:hypothetical protein